jgi:hypothetical protein
MFEGLYPFERVLMVLGIILFALAAFAFVTFVVQKRRLGPLLAFFLLPVLMIGFPAVQKISYDNGKLTFEMNLRRFLENPGDPKARTDLQASVEKMAGRSAADPQTGLMVAQAFQALDMPQRALTQVDSVLRVNPRLPEAMVMREELTRASLRRRLEPDRRE